MHTLPTFFTPAEAARQLGVSAKALRLYEHRGLVVPGRTAAGWRSYGPDEMARAAEIVALRALGLSLAQVGRVLAGDGQSLDVALAGHQAVLEARIAQLVGAVQQVGALRADIGKGKLPAAGRLADIVGSPNGESVAFDLPWPWGGERFELRDIAALTYIIGPLGSGKTRLAKRLAEVLPGATFLGLDRLTGGVATQALDADAALKARVERDLAWLIEDGATMSDALLALLACLDAETDGPVVIDMVEDGLDQASQEAVIAHLRRRQNPSRPLFLMTRSSAILDLGAVGPGEAILLCPANHSPPTLVAPYPGSAGYEAVATCLATPDVRARTAGVIALRPGVAEASVHALE